MAKENGTGPVRVNLGRRSYDIRIGAGLIGDAGTHAAPLIAGREVAVVTDENVARHHLAKLRDSFERVGVSAACKTLRPGEDTKSWAELQSVVGWLLSRRIERNGLIVALGGGVVGDLAGFAAAILRRGVACVQIPTSLLAQVDSSVGGKTGINVEEGKNLVGAFHQPSLVLCDLEVLDTLPKREFLSGYAEVAKYGLLGDRRFFEWLEGNGQAMLEGNRAALGHAVRRSCSIKAGIVADDEREHGRRSLLNLGHTFCHALEAATGYSDRLRHGEGVAIGCCLAFEASLRLGYCSPDEPERVRAHFRRMGMKSALSDVPGPLPSAEALMELMRQDKKVVGGKRRFILAKAIGDAFVCDDADEDIIRRMLAEELALATPQ